MKNKWVKKSDFNYHLMVGENTMGEMQIHFNTFGSKAVCNIEEKVTEIKKTGFWKSNLEITDSQQSVILLSYPEKWYANTSIIEFDYKKYRLIIRNNPLAEYGVIENDKAMLAYGLDTAKKELKVRSTTSGDNDLIFDFLLWYLFLPIANENFGDTYSFFMASSL